MATGENRRRAAGVGQEVVTRTATQSGRNSPADPQDLWTSMWTHQPTSGLIREYQAEENSENCWVESDSDAKKWAIQEPHKREYIGICEEDGSVALRVVLSDSIPRDREHLQESIRARMGLALAAAAEFRGIAPTIR